MRTGSWKKYSPWAFESVDSPWHSLNSLCCRQIPANLHHCWRYRWCRCSQQSRPTSWNLWNCWRAFCCCVAIVVCRINGFLSLALLFLSFCFCSIYSLRLHELTCLLNDYLHSHVVRFFPLNSTLLLFLLGSTFCPEFVSFYLIYVSGCVFLDVWLTIKERQLVTISVGLYLESRTFNTHSLSVYFSLFSIKHLYCGSVSSSIQIKLYKNIFIQLFK